MAETVAEGEELKAEPDLRVRAEALAIQMDPHLSPVAFTGNLGRLPGYVQTGTIVPGGTTRAPDLVMIETSPVLKLKK